jgi:3-hydroxyisobutyrate dehydrogenase-like beta-hydroxyacid dehydrogenase
MVETTDQAESVILGEKGIIQSAKQGDIVLCMSTIDPLAARRFAEWRSVCADSLVEFAVKGFLQGVRRFRLSTLARTMVRLNCVA